ncbi:MAG: hypothetical protein HKN73_18760 [Gemmatimonadetes bacterium]|nr:hypothetical protein [Gemmatimonadota bacterium]
MFWDLVQQSQIGAARDKTKAVERRTLTLEKRLALLEDELRFTQDLLVKLVRRLEQRFGEDLDGDGEIGEVTTP